MLFRVIRVTVLASILLVGDILADEFQADEFQADEFQADEFQADDGPTSHTIREQLDARPEFAYSSGPAKERFRRNIDAVVAETPQAITEAVERWTGISDRGKSITVKFFHTPANSRFDAMSHGDGYSMTASVKARGRTLSEHDTRVSYKEALVASDERSFSVLGIYRFENRVSRRECYVVCHIQGEKPVSGDSEDTVIHPTGTATWTGPLTDVSSPLFSER